MASTKTATSVEEYDFDNWSEEAEEAALRALNDVKYVIVEGTFVGRFSDGTIVKIPLSLKLGMIDELQEKFASPVDQFRHLLRTFAGDDVADGLAERSLIPVAIMTEKYFRCLGRAQELAFPESSRSSS
jgi:hypothetical protein